MGLRHDVARMKLGTAAKGRGPSGRAFLHGPSGMVVVSFNALAKIRRDLVASTPVTPKQTRISRSHRRQSFAQRVVAAGEAIMVGPWGLPRARDNRRHPQMPGVYFVFLGSELIYIGQSRNLRNRMKSHEVLKTLERLHPGEVGTASILVDITDLDTVEYSLIKTFRPRMNRMMSPRDSLKFLNKGSK